MENLSRLVSDSLTQNGVSIALNYQRLEWSRWFRCESSFSVLLAPSKPGIFALGEEIVSPNVDVELRASSPVETSRQATVDGNGRTAGKRMLALFEIAETNDLGLSLGRLFLPRSPLREKLDSGRCFARFTVIEDAVERGTAYAALRNWMEQSAETACGLTSRDQDESRGADILVRDNPEKALAGAPVGESQPSFSFPWGVDAPQRELNGKTVGPARLPSAF